MNGSRHARPGHHARLASTLFGLLLAAGCGEATRSAPEPPQASVATYEPHPSGTLTFAKDIAPIVFQNCAPCHRPGESAPFSFLTYEDVKRRARQIAEVTASGFMPPWLPEPGYARFEGERRLGVDEIGLIGQWVSEGAPEGDRADLPELPRWAEGWQLGEPDLIVRLDRPYILPSEGVDVFRNFVIPIPIEAPRYVKTVELRPGNKRIVHHAVMEVDRTPSSRRLDAKDAEPGFDGMFLGDSQSPGGFFLGWSPGRMPSAGIEGAAWRLEKGTDLVLQLHLLPTGKPEPIQPSIGFYFTDEPPRITPALLRLGSESIDIAANEEAYVIQDSLTLPVEISILAIYPHAHYLGKEMKAWAELPGGEVRWLLWIKEWDFNWQDEFRYAEPIRLPAGTRLKMRYTYDNTAANVRNPNQPPKRIAFGPNSSDEMGDLWIQALPANADDWSAVVRAAVQKDYRISLAGFEKSLAANPGDAETHFRLAIVLGFVNRVDESISHYQEAIALDPDYSDAHQNLGTTLGALGRGPEAMFHLRRALEIDPGSVDAHYNMGLALVRVGLNVEAARHFEAALDLEPHTDQGVDVRHELARALLHLGEIERAIGLLRVAVAAASENSALHNTLGAALATEGEFEQALTHFGRAVELDPTSIEARRNFEQAQTLVDR